MALYTKGESGNKRGRPKGVPNKSSEHIKSIFAKLLENNLPKMQEYIQRVANDDPAKAIELMIKISERFVPKLSQQALTDAEGGDLFKNITFNFNKLKK
jgi:hypothetical protein